MAAIAHMGLLRRQAELLRRSSPSPAPPCAWRIKSSRPSDSPRHRVSLTPGHPPSDADCAAGFFSRAACHPKGRGDSGRAKRHRATLRGRPCPLGGKRRREERTAPSLRVARPQLMPSSSGKPRIVEGRIRDKGRPMKSHMEPVIRQKSSALGKGSEDDDQSVRPDQKRMSHTMPTLTAMKRTASRNALRMRSKRLAPQFWPRIGPTPRRGQVAAERTGTRRSMIAVGNGLVSIGAEDPDEEGGASGVATFVAAARMAIAYTSAHPARVHRPEGSRGRAPHRAVEAHIGEDRA